MRVFFLIFLFVLGTLHTVSGQIQANFVADKNLGCSPLLVMLSDSSVSQFGLMSYHWQINGPSFSFNSSSNFSNISLTLEDPGYYNVNLVVCDSMGNCDSVFKDNYIEIYDLPDLDWNISTDSGCSPFTVCLNNFSMANCGSLADCIIDMGDGTVYNSSVTGNCEPCHTYTVAGNYNVTIVQYNSCGCSADTVYTSAYLVSSIPDADFTASPVAICDSNDSIQLVSTSTGGGLLNHFFYIDDSLYSMDPSFFVNTSSGTYDVSLIVENASGCRDTVKQSDAISVSNTDVDVFISDTVLCLGDTVLLEALTTDIPDSSIWRINGPDSFVVYGDAIAFEFLQSGIYNIQLDVYFEDACSITKALDSFIQVQTPPKNSISISDSVSCSIPFLVTFSSENQFPQMNWSFPGGITDSLLDSQYESVLYNSFGSFLAELTVTDSAGCISTIADTDILQIGEFEIGILSDKQGGCAPQTIQFAPSMNLMDSIVSVSWDFNSDGVIDDFSPNSSFTYNDTGCYTVSLIVEIAGGCSDTIVAMNLICIGDSGMVNVSGMPAQVCFDGAENCIDISGHSDSVWIEFGDGYIYSGPSPTTVCHLYSEIDTFHPVILPFHKHCLIDSIQLQSPFVVSGPKAMFRDSGECTLTVHFINESVEFDSLFWDFGDLTSSLDTSSAENPVWTYNQHGSYDVILTAFDSAGICSHSFHQQIDIIDPTALFYADTTQGCAPFTTVFHNISPAFNPWTFTYWDFNGAVDGLQVSSGWGPVNPQFTFKDVGSYDVAMRFRNGLCDDTLLIEDYIQVYGSQVSITADVTSGCAPLTVNFNSDSTVNEYSKIESYTWYFGDGDSSLMANPVHTFKEAGVHDVILVVTDSLGCLSADTLKGFVEVHQPKAEFLLSDTILCPGQYSFITNLNDPVTYQYEWYLDDSLVSNSSGSFILPVFDEEGEFEVTMVIADQFSCTDSLSQKIIVDKPDAAFSLDASFALCPPLVVNFTDSSEGYIEHWLWTFGNGSGSQSQNPSVIYNTVGNFEVGLVVTSVAGCRDTAQVDIVHVDGPTADISLSRNSVDCPCAEYEAIITTYNTQSASFLPGNGSVIQFTPSHAGTIANPAVDTMIFNVCQPGVYSPMLSISSMNGCNRVLSISDSVVLDTPIALFGHTPIDFCDSGMVCFQDESETNVSGLNITSWSWDFGNGITDSTASPCSAFTNPGIYPITLTVENNLGCRSSYTDTLLITETPEATIGLSDSVLCINEILTISYEGTSGVSLYWSVLDSAFDDSLFMLSMLIDGSHDVELYVENSIGCNDSMSRTVVVYPLPSLELSNDTTICSGDTLELLSNATGTVQWIGDSSIIFTNGNSVLVNPQNSTTYNAFTIDGNLCENRDSVSVILNHLDAQFTVDHVCISSPTIFHDASSFSTGILHWSWDFGDSNQSAAQHPQHQYTDMGSYLVFLEIIDSLNCTDTMSAIVKTLDATIAGMNVSAFDTCLGEPICFSTLTSPSVNSFWDVDGDGISDHTGDTFCYNFPSAGIYNSFLIVADSNGCKDTVISTITIADFPLVSIQADDVCLGSKSLFLNNSSSVYSPISEIDWNIANEFFSDEFNTDYTFSDTGSYDFQLVISNEEGCESIFDGVTTVHPEVDLTIHPKDTVICEGESVNIYCTGAAYYIWDNDAGIDTILKSSVKVSPLATTIFEVEGLNDHCPSESSTSKVRVVPRYPFEIEEIMIDFVLGQSYVLNTINPVYPNKIIWSPDTAISCLKCFNPVINPTENIEYQATAYWRVNGITCTRSDSIEIKVHSVCNDDLIFLPNAFTPDRDGKNDILYVRGRGIEQVLRFSVFNRWGEKIYENIDFEPNDENFGWDGNNANNEKLNTGVYVYFVEVICENGDRIDRRGNVQLIR